MPESFSYEKDVHWKIWLAIATAAILVIGVAIGVVWQQVATRAGVQQRLQRLEAEARELTDEVRALGQRLDACAEEEIEAPAAVPSVPSVPSVPLLAD